MPRALGGLAAVIMSSAIGLLIADVVGIFTGVLAAVLIAMAGGYLEGRRDEYQSVLSPKN